MMEGVQSQTIDASEKNRSIRINAVVNDMQRVQYLCQHMPQEARCNFNRRYGQILDLLRVTVEKAALSALAQFWKSDIRCFELPNLDIVPTLEEYKRIIGFPVKESAGVYTYGGSYVDGKKIARLIGMPAHQFSLGKKGSVHAIRKAVFENHLEDLAREGNWAYFSKTLALAIFGLVLFPFTVDFVDQAAMDVFFQYEMQGAHPVTAILADTFLSMEVCHEIKGDEKKGGTLRCCPHLLYVWIITHVHAKDHMGPIPNALKDFWRIPKKVQGVGEWKNEFASMELRTFKWVCPWYHPNEVIFSCGDFHNVPLMGSRGCVAYTPAIALLQLKRTQVIPSYEQLGGLSFLYGKEGTKGLEAQVKRAWKNVHKKGDNELGRPRLIISKEYEEWRAARDVQSRMQKVDPVAQRSNQDIASMVSQIEMLKAQVISLEGKKDQEEVKAIRLQHQCKKMGEKIEELKKDCDNAYREPKRARSTSYELQKSQEKVKAQEIKLGKLLEEKDELKAEIQCQEQAMEKLKEELIEARAYADKSWSLFKEYHDSLMMANHEGEIMKKKIEELTVEVRQWRIQAYNSQMEKDKLIKRWLLMAEELERRKNVWMDKYLNLSRSVHYLTRQWLELFRGASGAALWLKLPPKIDEFMKYCQKIAKDLRKMKKNELM